MKPEWRRILQGRSVKDKIGIAIDCDLAPVGELNIVAELVREGIIEWMDRACLGTILVINRATGEAGIGVNTDIYRLTPKGIALCEAEGIPQR